MSARTLLSHPLSLSLGSALLYIVLSDFPAYAWPLGFIALVPLFFLIRREPSTRKVFWYGFLSGTVAIAGTFTWALSAYPLEWAGVTNHTLSFCIVVASWAVTSILFGGMFVALFSVLSKKLGEGDWLDVLIVPSLWVLVEFSRALFVSLAFLGDQSSLGPDWVGFFGYSLAWSHMLASFVAPLGGVYLVSFVGVAVSYAIFLAMWKFRRERFSLACLFIATALGVFYWTDQAIALRYVPEETKTVAVITTDFPASFADGLIEIGTKAASLERLIATAVRSAPDIIVLPEDSRALEYLGSDRIQDLLDRAGKEILLIDSSPALAVPGKHAVISFYSSSARAVAGTSDKEFLMPFGEYVPYAVAGAARLLGQSEWLSSFNDVRGYQRGKLQTYAFQEHRLGALFCSEIIPDSPYRSLAQEGADIFLNVASHADFHENGGTLYSQTLSTAKMKAASHQRYFIQAGNYLPSFALDAHGNILEESDSREGVLLASVGFNAERTLYTRFGDWVIILALVVVIGSLWSRRRDLLASA